jgi:hypothetical protein
MNEKLAEEPQEVAEFRAKCIAAVERCDDPDIIEAMVCIKRLYEASQAENERLQRVVEQACKATDLRLTTIGQMPIGCPDTRHRDADEEVFAGCGALGRTFLAGEITDYPDLFAQLKGADRG